MITDENIHPLVDLYVSDKSKLPDELKNVRIGKWDVSRVTNFNYVFANFQRFNEPLEWDTSNAVKMRNMFTHCKKFNQTLKWNVKKVKNMHGIFEDCTEFNQPLDWETDSLENTDFMFSKCEKFNQPLNWNMRKVKTMRSMFSDCTEFNQPLDWETDSLENTENMFGGCLNFNQPLKLKMGKVKSIKGMFGVCSKFNQPLEWDVSQVEDMSITFASCYAFNQSLKWDVSKVTTMHSMFYRCLTFDGVLSGISTPHWDVRNVQTMRYMFMSCLVFNQPIDWDTREVNNMSGMFTSCEKLNKPIRLNLIKVIDMSAMFGACKEFNQPLDFDVSKVENMENLFDQCEHFNQTLRWDVSSVNKMYRMFGGCVRFNSPLIGTTTPHWDVSHVHEMTEMFEDCERFNQPLVWNVEHVEFMSEMFRGCVDFNQPLAWNLVRLEECHHMFEGATSFNQNLTQWDLREVEEKEDMFIGCGIEERNLPMGVDPASPVAFRPRAEVDARQIHEFSSKVDIERLNAFFKSKTTLEPEKIEDDDIAGFLQDGLTGLIQQLETYVGEQEKGKVKELKHLNHSIHEVDITRLGVPAVSLQTLETLYQLKKRLMDQIHTSKKLTQPIHYRKKVDRLLSMATMKRKVALEKERELLIQLEKVDMDIKKVRLDKIKKDKLMALLEERDKMRVLSGRKNLLEHEIRNERDKIAKHYKDLDKIMGNVLSRIKFYIDSPPWRMSMMYALDYVERQPILFKKAYVEAFLKDCVNAYEGAAGMSCAAGVMERFVVSLMSGCGASLSVSENPEYEYIKGIVENGLNKLIPEYILKWYKLHSHPPHLFTTETREERLDNLKQYLLSFFPENEELILKLIPEYAIDVDNDDFAYKKENSAERINMNDVYASSSPKGGPRPVQSLPTRLMPKPRTKKQNAANRLKKTISNRKSKPQTKTQTKTFANRKPKPQAKKTVKLGTAFG